MDFLKFRKSLYRIIEPSADGTKDVASYVYDVIMITAIAFGITPLMFKSQNDFLNTLDFISLVCFLIDYFFRWITADLRGKRRGRKAFLTYPFTLAAIVDLLSILPSFLKVLNPSLKLFRLSRLLKILRFVRVFKYYEPLRIVISVVRKEGRTLMAVVSLAISYIFITALIMFNVEFENELAGEKAMFNNIFDAIYWAACTLTTVGYGDIYPVSATGRLISMVSAIVGVAIIALPSGIITAGYMDELKVRREQKELKKGGGHHDSQNNQNAQ